MTSATFSAALLGLSLFQGSIAPQEPPKLPTGTPAEIASVIGFMLKHDYPEVYSGKHYRARVRGLAVGDLLGEGVPIVCVLLDPHYHQTPPIRLFRVEAGGRIKRLREALAPGPLLPFNLERMDPHTLGAAADVTATNEKDPDSPIRLARELAKKMQVILYPGFIHFDQPEGTEEHGGTFVDVSDRREYPKATTCEAMQFSQPSALCVGKVDGLGGPVRLAVQVGRDVYLYRITGISEDGFLEKDVTRIPLKSGDEKLEVGEDGVLAIRTGNPGEPLRPLRLPVQPVP